LPPSKEELERRIRNRGTEKEEAINRRLSRSSYEIASSDEFDFKVTNRDVDETAERIIKIIRS
jgi:guanylate kinase